MSNSQEIFAIALGLESPWHIKEVNFNKSESRLDIHLGFTKGHKSTSDDGNSYTAYDTVARTWQHLNFFQHHCYLHAKVPRVKQNDGKVITQSVPWARAQSGFTLLFEAFSMLLIENEMPINKAAKVLGIYPNRIWTIFNYWISRAHSADKIDALEQVGFDETSTRKGHHYVTTMVDLEERRVLYASQGKDSDCIKKSVVYLEEKEVDVNKVEQVCIVSVRAIASCLTFISDLVL